MRYAEKCCKLLVNMVSSEQEGMEVYRQLELVTHRFLEIEIEYLGCILFDDKITKGIKRQKLISELFPGSKASRCFVELAKKIAQATPASRPKGNTNFFWHHLVHGRRA
jgi:flagellar biosynthesis protein FlhG